MTVIERTYSASRHCEPAVHNFFVRAEGDSVHNGIRERKAKGQAETETESERTRDRESRSKMQREMSMCMCVCARRHWLGLPGCRQPLSLPPGNFRRTAGSLSRRGSNRRRRTRPTPAAARQHPVASAAWIRARCSHSSCIPAPTRAWVRVRSPARFWQCRLQATCDAHQMLRYRQSSAKLSLGVSYDCVPSFSCATVGSASRSVASCEK